MSKYYVSWWCTEAYADMRKTLFTKEELLKWIEDNPHILNDPNSHLTVIKGEEVKLVPVEVTTKWRIDE